MPVAEITRGAGVRLALNLRGDRLVAEKLPFELHKDGAVKKVSIVLLALEYVLAEETDALDNSSYANVDHGGFPGVEGLAARL